MGKGDLLWAYGSEGQSFVTIGEAISCKAIYTCILQQRSQVRESEELPG